MVVALPFALSLIVAKAHLPTPELKQLCYSVLIPVGLSLVRGGQLPSGVFLCSLHSSDQDCCGAVFFKGGKLIRDLICFLPKRQGKITSCRTAAPA